jgi:uncharacterized protein YndB with AHSA1/START domain
MQPGNCVNTDSIEKKILLRASPQRVWRALSDFAEFGTWFGVRFTGPFTPGASLRGVIVPTTVDAQVAAAQKPYEGRPFDITIEKMEPERLFSFRWHPFALEPGVDYSGEPTTLVEFVMDATADGVMLTITESGFDGIPLARRAAAFKANSGGWSMVLKLISQYVSDVQ